MRMIAIIAISPLLASHCLCSQLAGCDVSLESHSQALSLLPGRTGSYLRVAFYRFTLNYCAANATICFGVLFSKSSANVHEYVYIGPRCLLGSVTLEQDVLLGPAVQIPSGPQTHGIERLDIPVRMQPGQPRHIVVGRDSWIGAAAVVLADVGAQCVIGAGSIVTKPIETQHIAVGNPARSLGARRVAGTLSSADSSSLDCRF